MSTATTGEAESPGSCAKRDERRLRLRVRPETRTLPAMRAIAAVFALTLLAAALWHGGKAAMGARGMPAWLHQGIDTWRNLWLLGALLPILALLGLGGAALWSLR